MEHESPSLAERERQYRLLAELTADVRYCYEVHPDGVMTRGWIAGAFPGIEDVLPERIEPEGCWWRLAHPEDRELVQARHERLRRGERSIDEFRIVLPERGVRWMRVFGLPERAGEEGRVVRILGAAQDVTAQRGALEAAQRSRAQLRLITEELPVLVAHVGPDQRYRQVNAAFERWFGLPREQILGASVRELIGEQAYGEMRPHLEEILRGGMANLENTLRSPDGRSRSVMLTLLPGDAADPAQGFYMLATDVSELKEAERRQGVLISELDHRVKNVLAVVQGMVKLTAGAPPDESEFATVLLGRIQALARAHDLLARSGWRGADLDEVVRGALAPFAPREASRIRIEGEPVRVGPRAVASLAIICHELAVNAVRHGALADPAGRVDVRWRMAATDGPGRIELEWAESGERPVVPPERRGFGTLLIERAAAYELGGSSLLDFRPDGLYCRLELPLAEVTPSTG